MPGNESQNELFLRQQKVNEVRLLSMKYGKVKKAITQGLRGGAGEGVCSAIVNNWILSGVDVDTSAPKQRRREFRQHWAPGEDMPQKFIDDQDSLDQFSWMNRTSAKSGTIAILDPLVSTVQTYPEDAKQSAAYFFLDLNEIGSTKGHAVGLKRGKIQSGGLRYYSLLDPNYFEVTHIFDLPGLIKEMVKFSWSTYFYWNLVHVTKKEKQPAVEDELAKSRKTNKEMDDILKKLQEEFN
jgi:hypothetical protein